MARTGSGSDGGRTRLQALKEDPVAPLVAECVERFPDEGEAAIESICRAHPEYAEEIRRAFRHLLDMGLVGDDTTVLRTDASFPERLGEFRLIRRLGGGGMGVVYLAEHEALGRRVALKLVRPEHLYFPGARARFRREVETVARLQHPGIVPIYSFGEASHIPYFAMEAIEGSTLAQVLTVLADKNPARLTGNDMRWALSRLRSGATLSPPSADADALFAGSWEDLCFRIVVGIGEALHHAHINGVIHRDVKSSNIILTLDGRVMLFDFGLAQSSGSERLTRTSSQLGSLAYMSSEAIRGSSDAIDQRTDTYALGVTLYEILTLSLPYHGETTESLMGRIIQGQPEGVRLRNRAASWEADTVCLKAMDPEPVRRYASALEFVRDARNVLERRPILARSPGPWLRARRWGQRHPLASLSILLALQDFVWVRAGLG